MKSICLLKFADNLNYNIPHYSVFSNYRPDFEIVEDDPVEILIENLILKQLEQQDPTMRGSLINNTHMCC